MAELGSFAVLLALMLATYAGVGSVLGPWRQSYELTVSARRAVYLVPLTLMVATAVLVEAFVSRDFQFSYVADHSSRSMEPWLTWVAFYAGNEGSLLFLVMAFSVLSALAVAFAPAELRRSLPSATLVLMGVTGFLLLVILTMADPFEQLATIPADGRGINPLLRHPGMFIHPPMLMTGLIGVAIPFAFAMGHLISGQTGDEWVGPARTWGIIIWAILGLGLLLGAWWAYTILGWGGYWAWDPVENAGLLPWLPLTAFIHSIMVQRRKGMFRMWNIALIIIAWGLAMYGMFMNRGGPIPSVHSFAQSTMGWVFLGFMAGNVLLAFALFIWRYPRLRSSASLESTISREAAFLLNNLLFLLIAGVVLWGLVYPILSQNFRDITVTVGRPFYDTVAGPLFLVLILTMAIGPLIPWRRASLPALRRNLLWPIVMACMVALLSFAVGIQRPVPLLSFAVCGLVATGILLEWWRGTVVRHRKGENYLHAFLSLVASNRPRYGGYIVHLAIVLLAFSITGSSFYSKSHDVSLKIGERIEIEGYTVEYISATAHPQKDRIERRATVHVYDGERMLEALTPGYAFYPSFSIASTRAGIRSTVVEDLYIVANEFAEDGSAIFRISVNPLVIWMWIAGPILIIGTLIALWPEPRFTASSIAQIGRNLRTMSTGG